MTSKNIDRRGFLKLGAAASGLAISSCGAGGEESFREADYEMRYRPLGDTRLEVSEISFGRSVRADLVEDHRLLSFSRAG